MNGQAFEMRDPRRNLVTYDLGYEVIADPQPLPGTGQRPRSELGSERPCRSVRARQRGARLGLLQGAAPARRHR